MSKQETVNLTQRELQIYQSGQNHGYAQACKVLAEHLGKVGEQWTTEANARAVAGNALLDQVFPKRTSLKSRVSSALKVLVGRQP